MNSTSSPDPHYIHMNPSEFEALKEAVGSSPLKAEIPVDSLGHKVMFINKSYSLELKELGSRHKLSTLVETLERINQEAIHLLEGQPDINERQKIASKINDRHQLISTLKAKISHSSVALSRTQRASRLINAYLKKIPQFANSMKVGALKLAREIGVKLSHHPLPKVSKESAIHLLNALNDHSRDKVSFRDSYDQLSLYQGVSKVLITKNRALIAAIRNGKKEDLEFILEKGLFKTINKHVLENIDQIPFQTEKEKIDLIHSLFIKCNEPESLSNLVKYLKETGRKDLAKEMLTKTLEANRPGQSNAQHEKYLRCQMLVPSFGDLELFNKAFDIDLKSDFKNLNPTPRERFIHDFIEKNKECLNEVSKHGETIMHQACMGDHVLMTAFLYEAMTVRNQEVREPVESVLVKIIHPLKLLLIGDENQMSFFRSEVKGSLMEIKKTLNQVVGNNVPVSAETSAIIHDEKKVKAMQFLKEDLRKNSDGGALLKSVDRLLTEIETENYKENYKEMSIRQKEASRKVMGGENLEQNSKLLIGINEEIEAVPKEIKDAIDQTPSRDKWVNKSSVNDVIGKLESIYQKMRSQNKHYQTDLHPFRMSDKDGIKPLHLMNMKLANGLDEYYGVDGNKKGSMSNAVGFYQLYSRRIPARILTASALAGKYVGAVAATSVLEAHPALSTLMSGLASNSLLFGGIFAGLGLAWKGVKLVRGKITAGRLGIDDSLSLYGKKVEMKKAEGPQRIVNIIPTKIVKKGPELTPKQALKRAIIRRDLSEIQKLLTSDVKKEIVVSMKMVKSLRTMHFFFIGGVDQRASLLKMLCERAAGQKEVFKLLSEQIDQGYLETVGDTVTQLMQGLQHGRPLESQERILFEASLLIAARIGSLPEEATTSGESYLERIIGMTPAIISDNEPQFLLKIINAKTGDNLLHMAVKSKNLKAISFIADEMVKASNGQPIEYVRPRAGPLSLFYKTKTKKTKYNIFEMRNTAGQRIYDMMDRNLANRLDEAYGFQPLATGSFTELYQRRIDKHHNELLAEVFAVGPVKAGLNIAIAAKLALIVDAASSLADSHIPGTGIVVGAARLMLVGAVTWAAELAVMAAGFGTALIGGKGLGGAISDVQNKRQGLQTELVQFSTITPNYKTSVTSMKKRTAFGRSQARELSAPQVKSVEEQEAQLHLQSVKQALLTFEETAEGEALRPLLNASIAKLNRVTHDGGSRLTIQKKLFEVMKDLPTDIRQKIHAEYCIELNKALAKMISESAPAA